MTLFQLEALDARSGDALLVHFGSENDRRLLIVDGGFASTYEQVLNPCLKEERELQGLDASAPLPVDLVVVSHLDRDHISGIVRLLRELRDESYRGDPPSLALGRIWHNSFTDSLLELGEVASLPRKVAPSTVLQASIGDARELRDLATLLSVRVNAPFDALIVAPRVIELGEDKEPKTKKLEVTVVGPTEERLNMLRDEWRRDVSERLRKGEFARVAAYVDRAIPNLSSIVLHLRQGDRSMLLTGDARGDDTLRGLEASGLCDPEGRCRVDILKVPHHGSERNVDLDYFERIVADHYLISADGSDDNPSHETLRMLVSSQKQREYQIHLTYEASTGSFFEADRAANARNYKVKVRPTGGKSILVALGPSNL